MDDAMDPMEPTFGTVIRPERSGLLGYIGCSVLAHAATFASMFGVSVMYGLISVAVPFCNQPPRLHEAIEVSLVALPKSEHNVPDRAARAKVVTGEEPVVPVPEPPPVKESDLVIHKENPEPDPGIDAEEKRRQELLAKIERQRLLEAMDAPDGPVDRNPTDPNGSADLDLAVLGASSRGDPELARWVAQVQALLKQRFHPLAQGDNLKTMVHLELDAGSGRILSAVVSSSSGVVGFDQAALRVAEEMGSLPPPPVKFQPLIAAEGVDFKFVPP